MFFYLKSGASYVVSFKFDQDLTCSLWDTLNNSYLLIPVNDYDE